MQLTSSGATAGPMPSATVPICATDQVKPGRSASSPTCSGELSEQNTMDRKVWSLSAMT